MFVTTRVFLLAMGRESLSTLNVNDACGGISANAKAGHVWRKAVGSVSSHRAALFYY